MEKKVNIFLRGLVAMSAVLGFIGWSVYDGAGATIEGFWLSLYKTVCLFIMNNSFDHTPVPWFLALAAYFAPISLTGTLLWTLIHSSKNWMTSVYLRLFVRRTVIIAGTVDTAENFLKGDQDSTPIVLILPPGAYIPDTLLHKHLFIMTGRTDEARTWRRADLLDAKSILVFPDTQTSLGDIKDAIVSAWGMRQKPTMQDVTFFIGDKRQHEVLAEKPKLLDGEDGHHFATSSVLHTAVAEFVLETAPHTTLRPDELENRAPHIIVDGYSDFAKAYLVEAGQLYHYPCMKKPKITLACDDPERTARDLALVPGLFGVLDLKIMDRVELDRILRSKDDPPWEGQPSRVVLVPDDIWAVPENAIQWRRFFVLRGGDHKIPAIDAVVPSTSSSEDFSVGMQTEFADIGLSVHRIEDYITWENLVSRRELNDAVARQIHEEYLRSQGKDEVKAWEELPEREREFNRRSARHLRIKLWYLGFRLETGKGSVAFSQIEERQKDILSQMEHRRWNSEKLLDNFLQRPSPSDVEEKMYYKEKLRIHNLIKPFEELDMEEVKKDEGTFKNLEKILSNITGWKMTAIEGR